jgi:4-hydroxy-tetrahydrodipicolinate reductase
MTAAKPIKIGVSGAMGRMGGVIAEAVSARPDLELAALFDRAEFDGQSAHGRPLTSRAEAIKACDVIIDFSTPAASVELARLCAGHGRPALVIAATGLSQQETRAIDEAAKVIPLVRSANLSLGVNLMLGLVRQAAKALRAEDWDIEISEAHHHRKVDAPSGTALMLGEAAANGRGVSLAEVSERGRDGLTGPRSPGAIGFSVVRGGGIVGEHAAMFIAEDEIITFAHSARDRSLFARGALAAAVWLAGQPPGLYDMMDVLGFAREPTDG